MSLWNLKCFFPQPPSPPPSPSPISPSVSSVQAPESIELRQSASIKRGFRKAFGEPYDDLHLRPSRAFPFPLSSEGSGWAFSAFNYATVPLSLFDAWNRPWDPPY